MEVSTGCTGAAGPFLLVQCTETSTLYTSRLYSRVATLVCLDFAFLVFSVVWRKHSPTSTSGTQASWFVCRCIIIPEVQWVVPVSDSFFPLEISVVKYKRGGEFVFVKTLRCQCFSLQLFVCLSSITL